MIRTPRRCLLFLLAGLLVLPPGCLMGSPMAAISGEPYGMVRDDWGALGGKKHRIWSGAPVFAVIDLPIAFALDTALLPIALIMWGVTSLAEPSEEEGEPREDRPTHGGDGHTHGDDGHTHGDDGHTHGDDGHTHGDDGHTHSQE